MTHLEPGTARHAAEIARVFDGRQPLRFLKHLPNDDAFHRGEQPGGAVISVVGMWDSMPPPLLDAVRARREASLTGRCPTCDAVCDVRTGAFWHENDCHAGDPMIERPMVAWARKVGRFARGRRLLEDEYRRSSDGRTAE